MAKRPFRTEESLQAEGRTRDKASPLLLNHGFDKITENRRAHGTAITQTIKARAPTNEEMVIHVRLCWRRNGRNAKENDYSAAQLRAKKIDDDWDRTLIFFAEQQRANGNSHTLFIQDGIKGVEYALLVPNEEIPAIWQEQRRVSTNLIASGQMGNLRKNHAENGSSPTIWLQDDRLASTHAVADVIWNWPNVVNVLAFPSVRGNTKNNDSFDDLSANDSDLGRDEGMKVSTRRSGYPRDPQIRATVLRRANGKCERLGCDESRSYKSFLDVHHILGIGISDRTWTCVALCPNCHRDAHFSPEHEKINEQLMKVVAEIPNVNKRDTKD